MRSFSISALSQPIPVYIPSRLAKGIPARRRKTNGKQQAAFTASAPEPHSQPKTQITIDPAMQRKDIDFISSLFVVDQLECEQPA
jgi:hypothetical protein